MENIIFLSIFVFIPLLMLLGLWAARTINQVRGVMVVGSTALLIHSIYLTFRFMAERAAGNTAEMLFHDKMEWFPSLNICYEVGFKRHEANVPVNTITAESKSITTLIPSTPTS